MASRSRSCRPKISAVSAVACRSYSRIRSAASIRGGALAHRSPTASQFTISHRLASGLLASPGVVSDSNGFFHPIGDHAQTQFSIDNQPVTDQQSRIYSNQISPDAVQSMEVISGAPPAEFGEKTSVVINVTTRSGQGMTTPKGSVTASYGSFGTADLGINFGYGGQKWGTSSPPTA